MINSDEELLRKGNFSVRKTDENLYSLVDNKNGQVYPVSVNQAAYLNNCEEFKTLDGHTQDIVSLSNYSIFEKTFRRFSSNRLGVSLVSMLRRFLLNSRQLRSNVAGVKETLTSLRQSKFLKNKSELLNSFKNNINLFEDNPPKDITVCIPTSGRPERLRETLQSLTENMRIFKQEAKILIGDDSVEISDQTLTREAVETASLANKNLKILYVSLESRRKFAEQIYKSSKILPLEILQFLLTGESEIGNDVFRGGSNRNSLMLMSDSDALVQIDDDVLIDIKKPPIVNDGVLFANADFNSNFFAESFNEIYNACESESLNFIDTMTKYLGRHPLSKSVLESDNLDVNSIDENFLRRIFSKEARIQYSRFGWTGDTVTPFSLPHHFCGNEFEREFARNQEKYKRYLNTSYLTQTPIKKTLSQGSWFIGVNFGMLMSNHHPFFMPILRGEDTFFGKMNKFFYDSFKIHLPHMIVHHRKESRSMILNPMKRLMQGNIFMSLIIDGLSMEIHQGQGADVFWKIDLPTIGNELIRISKMSDAAYVSRIAELFSTSVFYEILGEERILLKSENDILIKSWHRDLISEINTFFKLSNRKNLLNNEYFLHDVPGQTNQVKLMNFKKLLNMTGMIMKEWHGVVGIAKDLSLKRRA